MDETLSWKADFSTYQSEGPDGVEVGRLCDCVVACEGLRSKIAKAKVIEDIDSKPSKNQ